MNISSNEKGLGGALTNPTALAKKKGNVRQDYPVEYEGVVYEDAEAAYQKLKKGHVCDDDTMMQDVISEKLLQYPRLLEEIENRGGLPFLLGCSHFVGAKTDRAKSWEGQGKESRFIRNLCIGYTMAKVY